MANEKLTFKKGKTPREELELPTLHFIVADQWIDFLGDAAFKAWLKMYTFTDRKEEEEKNKWEESKIPTSFTKLIKRLGVGRETFYKKILAPLWNVGLIDIEEYEDSEQKGTKPMNIIVYKYPQNKRELATKPLENVRNYDTDYSSDARTFGKLGGRPKKEAPQTDNTVGQPIEEDLSKEKMGGVLIQNTIISLIINNSFNSLNNNFNLSISEEIENTPLPINLKKLLISKIDRLIKFKIKIVDIELHFHAVHEHFTEQEYSFVLNSLIDKMTTKPKTFASVMNDWLDRNRKKKNEFAEKKENSNKPRRTEIVPDWLHKEDMPAKPKEKNNTPIISEERKKAIWEQVEKLNG